MAVVILLFIKYALINGILVGIIATALSFLVVYMLKKGNAPNLLTYLVLLIMLVVVSFEGVLLSSSVQTKQETNNIVALAQDAVLTCLPTEGQDYVINVQQSHAIKVAIRVVSPSVAKKVDTSAFTGKTVAEATDVVRVAIERYVAGKVRARIILVIVSSILLAVFLFLSFGSKKWRNRNRKPDSGRENELIGATRYGGDDF